MQIVKTQRLISLIRLGISTLILAFTLNPTLNPFSNFPIDRYSPVN